MLIHYNSSDNRPCIIDLSSKVITGYCVSFKLGYITSGGSLIINWYDGGKSDFLMADTGIYPPVCQIKNFDEVMNYLKSLKLK